MRFSHSFHVESSDIDAQGHVNNVAYVRWIQDVAVAHWNEAVDSETRERLTWLLTRHEIDYLRQTFTDQYVTATTWVGNASRVTCERFTEICRGDEMLVRARSVWCLIDRGNLKPTRISKELRTVFGMTDNVRI
ncbi:MAG TPA: thioesterase family protein [Pyrinomonadaceae bacterium]|nr:thioesterase family protein [Pyrinomonadaceae bacterium]